MKIISGSNLEACSAKILHSWTVIYKTHMDFNNACEMQQ